MQLPHELIHANVAVTIHVEALKGRRHHHAELPKGEVLLGAHHGRQQITQSLHEVLARDLLLAVLAEHVVDALRIGWIQPDLTKEAADFTQARSQLLKISFTDSATRAASSKV